MAVIAFSAMSEKQLSAFLAALKADAGLQEKLKGAADLDAAVAIAKGAGFDVSKADWLKYQAKQTLELSDEELEGVVGGQNNAWHSHCLVCLSGLWRTAGEAQGCPSTQGSKLMADCGQF